jgi:hypothetical protein
MYCVYLTIYFGDKLPRRYIGSCRTVNIDQGYNGSVSSKKYKDTYDSERLANPYLFKTRILSSGYETDYDARIEELRLQKKYNVVKSKDYMNESYAIPNGFFGRDVSGKSNPMYGKSRKGEKHKGGENISASLRYLYNHTEKGKLLREQYSKRLSGKSNPMYGKTHTDEEKKKRSKRYSGKGNPMYGRTHNEEARKKISEARLGIPGHMKGKKHTEEVKQKLRKPKSESHKQNLRKTYIVNDSEIVDNAKLYCEQHGYKYGAFLAAARTGNPYKGMSVKVKE